MTPGGEHERILPWPPTPGASPRFGELVSLLDAEVDAAAPSAAGEGGALVLAELGPDDGPDFLRLSERLAELWEGRGLRTLVVDAHPARPFLGGVFGESSEGFTEILHYGLSPEAAAQSREGCAGLWIPAGGRWSLPLESPEEPGLSLYRLANQADRVLLLADATDAEGLLEALRERCHYRLQLVPATLEPEAAAASEQLADEAPEAAVVSEASTFEDSLPKVVLMDDGDRRRRWPLLVLLLAVLLVAGWALLFGPARGLLGRGEPSSSLAEGRGSREDYSPLPGPAELPYNAGTGETSDSGAVVQDPAVSRDRAGMGEPGSAPPPGQRKTTPVASRPGEGTGPSPEPVPASEPTPPPQKTTESAAQETRPPAPVAQLPASRPPVIRRRFEPTRAWRELTESSGPFFIHVESYRDSALADESARRRGFDHFGYLIQPSTIGGKPWYRMLIGPFVELPSAAAVRDSLLDQTAEDYCLLVTTAAP